MGQQDVRESSTFWFTLIEFEPVYQVCCVAAVNQGDDRMVGQRFREALTAEKNTLALKLEKWEVCILRYPKS